MNEQPTQLINKLRDPHRYGLESGEVELIETHISWVLLAGEFAYKLKKPVDLGFVDFSTLEKRAYYCDEEIRLNRRHAPEIYLGVWKVTGSVEDPKWNGDGPVIEYAVRMRRFSQSQLLPEVLARRELEPEHIDQLARDVALFHRETSIAESDSPWGNPESAMKPIRENFKHMRFPGLAEEFTNLIAELSNWSEQEFSRRKPDLQARKAGGFIRECHGDMHLGNMLLQDGCIRLFDCIEFNPSLRWIDVISEVAFLVMDLEDRGRRDLGIRFLNAYLAETGDYAALSLFRLYASYRAEVRAKVACLRAAQPGQTTAAINKIHDEFVEYLKLSKKETEAGTPAVIITCGLSGSGKTTLTQPLQETLGAIRIRSDIERKRLFGYQGSAQTDSSYRAGIYTADASMKTYARLKDLAGTIVRAGFPVIVDATFLKMAERAPFRELASSLQVPFLILEFDVPVETLRERISRRQRAGNDASEATLEVLERQRQTAEAITNDERPVTLKVTETELNPARVQEFLRID